MAAGVRYRKARLGLAAVVTAGVIGGTAYFAGATQPQAADASTNDAAVANVAGVVPAPAPARQPVTKTAPAKRSRGS